MTSCESPPFVHKGMNRGGIELRLAFEFRREKTVVVAVKKRVFDQKLSDRPIFSPVGPFVGAIVQRNEPRIELVSRLLRIKDLVNMASRHDVVIRGKRSRLAG